ncbi:SRPBCC domain-containing protein [Streptomyces sp. NBC_00984]|uniref:carbon monoxide dehydrogenase n=1 Tax=Streptomyces sp. NBC_00984 TaxID=2903700 RepID=UPI00386447B2|nr:SRPBCC domain-containing protein [Streptomyces sp. NBC_00984]
MEHEVFVPVPVPSLRRTLGDPARVARCVPGLQQDADAAAGPLSGRLKIRVDGHTITYRGALRLTDAPQDGPEGARGEAVLVTGEGSEARGSGSAKLTLTIGLTERDGGTAIGFAGTASGDGRLLELDAAAALAAARRLLDRFAQQLVTETLAAGEEMGEETGEAERSVGEAVEQAIEEAAEEADTTGAATVADDTPPTHDAAADEAPSAGAGKPEEPTAGEPEEPEEPGNPPGTGAVFDAPVPPPSLDPVSEVEFTVPEGPPAEAAHARRTMIGRSAEEVDHAPPRGRYAPVPSPDSTTAGATLRWVAPAAALALASAVVVSRALRRRR